MVSVKQARQGSRQGGQARCRLGGRSLGGGDILLAGTITLMLVFPSLSLVLTKQKQIFIFQKQINTY